jgi:hypothetical protein
VLAAALLPYPTLARSGASHDILLVVLAFPDPAFPSEEKDEKKALAAQAKESFSRPKRLEKSGELVERC